MNTLFKYYELNDNSINGLYNLQLYAPTPYQLNDLFDCHHSLLNLDNLTLDDVNQIAVIKISSKEELETIIMDSGKREKLQKSSWQNFFTQYGTLSFTNSAVNNLMWVYYCNHKGFVVEFDHSKFNFDRLGPQLVSYNPSERKNESSPNDSLANRLIAMVTIKKKEWVHEEESRILAIKHKDGKSMVIPEDPSFGNNEYCVLPRTFDYPVKAIKSITLGQKFFDKHRETKQGSENSTIFISLTDCKKVYLLDFIVQKQINAFYINPDYSSFELKRNPVQIKKLNNGVFQMEEICN